LYSVPFGRVGAVVPLDVETLVLVVLHDTEQKLGDGGAAAAVLVVGIAIDECELDFVVR